MDVDHPSPIGGDDRGGHQRQKAGQHHQLNRVGAQHREPLGTVPRVGKDVGHDSPGPGQRQAARRLPIAQDERDPSGGGTSGQVGGLALGHRDVDDGLPRLLDAANTNHDCLDRHRLLVGHLALVAGRGDDPDGVAAVEGLRGHLGRSEADAHQGLALPRHQAVGDCLLGEQGAGPQVDRRAAALELGLLASGDRGQRGVDADSDDGEVTGVDGLAALDVVGDDEDLLGVVDRGEGERGAQGAGGDQGGHQGEHPRPAACLDPRGRGGPVWVGEGGGGPPALVCAVSSDISPSPLVSRSPMCRDGPGRSI